jgi:hypothetical protein
MASGAIEQDFENITPGEAITLRHAVEDSAGAAIASFSGWTAATYITSNRAPNGLAELAAAALLTITPTLSVPNISSAITAANWTTLSAAMVARIYYYELWRTDSGNETRLAYGKITTKD